MNGERIYKITINGISESINAVDSLNKQLTDLENRIKALENANIKVGVSSVSSSSSKGGGGNTTVLTNDVALQKELNNLKNEGTKIDAKIEASQTEIYKQVQATKELYKEVIADQKQIEAQERLIADSYSNTMAGMKQHLADLKTMINTTDLGDSDRIKQMTQEANELTNKLKEMEESYGVFSRSVGDYAKAADGFTKFKVQVGDTVREFSSARQASKQLKQELLALDEGAEGAQELREAIQQVDSAIKDLNKSSAVMDKLLDTMESFTAIANVGQGIRGLFGVDDAEMQKSIKNLVALQNILKGIETINKQINTRQGIGAWIAPFNTQIDKATAKLLSFNTALLGTSKAAKTASVAINGFSKALKFAISAGILLALDLLLDGFMKLIDSLKKVDEEAERAKEVQKDLSKAYGDAKGKIIQYTNAINNFNGTAKQEKKLVEDLNREFGSTLGTYKTLSEWQKVLKEKGDAYIQTLVNQAKAQAAVNEVTAAYINLTKTQQDIESGKYKHWYATAAQERESEAYALEQANERIRKAEENLKKIVTENEDYMKEHGLGNYAPQITNNGDKSQKALEDVQTMLNKLELKLMRDGLNKKLRELDEEERQTINKLKENGRKSADEIRKVQKYYSELRSKEIREYLDKLEESIKQTANRISKVTFDINIKDFENNINELKNKVEKLSEDAPIRNTLLSETDVKTVKRQYNVDETKINAASTFNRLFNEAEDTNKADKYYSFLLNYIKDKDKELYQDIADYASAIQSEKDDKKRLEYKKGLEKTYDKVAEIFEDEYANELLVVRNYTEKIDLTLKDSLNQRLNAQRVYDDSIRKEIIKSIQEQGELNKKLLDEQEYLADLAEEERYESVQLPLQKQKDALEETIKKFSATTEQDKKTYEKLKNDLAVINKQMEEQQKQHDEKLFQIETEYTNKRKQNEINTAKALSSEQEKYFSEQITNFRDGQSKINELLSKQPKTGILGIVNIPATKKQYKEAENAAKEMAKNIIAERIKLEVMWKQGLISPEAKNAITQQLNDTEAQIRQTFQAIDEGQKNIVSDFISSMSQYLQASSDIFLNIMDAVWAMEDKAFDAEQEQIEKQLALIEEMMQKQEDIIKQHTDNINDIESELATARGDRRQELIDKLNAEVKAEKKAQKEKQKLEAQKKKEEVKQDELERKRQEAEYNRSVLQAIVNGAMAVTFAGINTWPVPAIPMMALAAASTAAQLAVIRANRPYANGGLLTGPSHSEGGMPILGSDIVVEGSEYVINKRTTAQNVDVLDYINSSKKKLSLEDFVDFYGGNVRKNIMSVRPTTRFESGGIIPSINSSYNTVSDRLLTAFEKYAQHPTVVSVTEIEDKMADVNQIRVLAGLD